MATEQPIMDVTYEAYTNLAAYQFHFVKFTSDRTVTVCAALGTDKPCGVLQNAPAAAGAAAIVRVMGASKVIFAGTYTAGTMISSDASGHAITVNVGTNTTYYLAGQVAEGADADELGSVNLNCATVCRAA